jgi:hypothetical protein
MDPAPFKRGNKRPRHQKKKTQRLFPSPLKTRRSLSPPPPPFSFNGTTFPVFFFSGFALSFFLPQPGRARARGGTRTTTGEADTRARAREGESEGGRGRTRFSSFPPPSVFVPCCKKTYAQNRHTHGAAGWARAPLFVSERAQQAVDARPLTLSSFRPPPHPSPPRPSGDQKQGGEHPPCSPMRPHPRPRLAAALAAAAALLACSARGGAGAAPPVAAAASADAWRSGVDVSDAADGVRGREERARLGGGQPRRARAGIGVAGVGGDAQRVGAALLPTLARRPPPLYHRHQRMTGSSMEKKTTGAPRLSFHHQPPTPPHPSPPQRRRTLAARVVGDFTGDIGSGPKVCVGERERERRERGDEGSTTKTTDPRPRPLPPPSRSPSPPPSPTPSPTTPTPSSSSTTAPGWTCWTR